MNKIDGKLIGQPHSRDYYFKTKAKCPKHKGRIIFNANTQASFCRVDECLEMRVKGRKVT